MEKPFKDIKEIITDHYGELEKELYIEKSICKETPYICNRDKIEYLEKLIKAYESLFTYLKK